MKINERARASIDTGPWDTTAAKLHMTIKHLVTKHGHPPDAQPAAIQLVPAQMAIFAKERTRTPASDEHGRTVRCEGHRIASMLSTDDVTLGYHESNETAGCWNSCATSAPTRTAWSKTARKPVHSAHGTQGTGTSPLWADRRARR